MSIVSRKRRAKKRRDHRAFAAIVARGGTVLVHPDTLARMRETLVTVPGFPLSGVRLVPTARVKRGELVAVAPPDVDVFFAMPPYIAGETRFSGRLGWYGGIR